MVQMPRYLKARIKNNTNKKTTTSKPTTKVKKAKKLTKTRVREILHFRRLISYALMLFSIIVLIVNISLVINGGWDDIGMLLFVGAPLLAFLSMCVSYDSRKKYLAIKRDFWLGLVLFVVTGSLFCLELLFTQISPLLINKVEDSDSSIVGQYYCANSEEDRDAEKYTVEIYLSDKEFGIADYDDSEDYAIGSYGVFDAGENMRRLRAIIKQNNAKDAKRGFDETSYLFDFGEDGNVKVTSESYYVVRYCKRV